jgi:hypothetical protein
VRKVCIDGVAFDSIISVMDHECGRRRLDMMIMILLMKELLLLMIVA